MDEWHVEKGLLLSLCCILCSHVSGAQARPAVFVCSDRARKHTMNTDNLEVAMDSCDGSDVLPSPVQLPCVRIQIVGWRQKTLQQKRTELAGALRLLQDGVGALRRQSTLGCQASLLGRLEHHLRNHLLIVRQLEIQEDASQPAAPSECADQLDQSLSLRELLERYQALLWGRLERLAADLQHSRCPAPGQRR